MCLILNNLFVLRFAPFLDHTEPTQSVTEQNPLILTSTILPRPYPKVVHLLIPVPDYHLTSKILDIIILETYSEQVWESLYRFISSGCMTMLTLRHIFFSRIECASWESSSMQTLSLHPAFHNLGSLFSQIDCDVLDSSIDFAFSTSVIHDIVIWGFAVFAQTSVLKLTFQLSMESGNFARCSSEIGNLGYSIIPPWESVPPVWREIPSPQWRMFLELDKSCCSGLLFDPVVIVCSVSFGFTPREEDAKFRDFSRYFEVVLLEQVVVQKRRRYPSYWVFQAAIQNRGEAQFCNSDLLRVDW